MFPPKGWEEQRKEEEVVCPQNLRVREKLSCRKLIGQSREKIVNKHSGGHKENT